MNIISIIVVAFLLHSLFFVQRWDSDRISQNWHESFLRYYHLRHVLEEEGVIPSFDDCRNLVFEHCTAEMEDWECREAIGVWCAYRAPDRNQIDDQPNLPFED